MGDRKQPTPPPVNQVKPDPPPAPPAHRGWHESLLLTVLLEEDPRGWRVWVRGPGLEPMAVTPAFATRGEAYHAFTRALARATAAFLLPPSR